MLVEKSGIPMAALVSSADLARLVRFDREREEREQDFANIDEMREAVKDVPPAEIDREVATAIAEVRAEMEAERVAVAAATTWSESPWTPMCSLQARLPWLVPLGR